MNKNLGPQRKKEVIIYLQFSLLLSNIEKTNSLRGENDLPHFRKRSGPVAQRQLSQIQASCNAAPANDQQ